MSATEIRSSAARNARRRIVRQLGLRMSDLDGVGRGYVVEYVRCRIRLEALDHDLDERGTLDEHGSPRPAMSVYVALTNSARQSLQRLEARLKTQGKRTSALDDYLAGR